MKRQWKGSEKAVQSSEKAAGGDRKAGSHSPECDHVRPPVMDPEQILWDAAIGETMRGGGGTMCRRA